MTEPTSLTVAQMRTSAHQLRAVIEAIDSGTLKASGRERAVIAGALRAVELMLGDEATSETDGRSGEGD